MVVPVEVCELDPRIGRGVTAQAPISEGDVVAVFGGSPTLGEEFDQLTHEEQARSVQVGDDVFLVADDSSPAAMINHSCEPNLRMAGEITLLAARDIAVGEVLTYDYATTDGSPYDEFECFCGTPSCRRRVTGSDWERPDLQARYQGWFSPYLQRRIDVQADADRDASGGLVRL